jgi:hypothetical protein
VLTETSAVVVVAGSEGSDIDDAGSEARLIAPSAPVEGFWLSAEAAADDDERVEVAADGLPECPWRRGFLGVLVVLAGVCGDVDKATGESDVEESDSVSDAVDVDELGDGDVAEIWPRVGRLRGDPAELCAVESVSIDPALDDGFAFSRALPESCDDEAPSPPDDGPAESPPPA